MYFVEWVRNGKYTIYSNHYFKYNAEHDMLNLIFQCFVCRIRYDYSQEELGGES
jgi:hypothetical protein